MNPIDPPDPHSHQPSFTDAGPKQASSGAPPRPKRPKTSKACNACRKQKSRCERLVGDTEGCHRCDVIGIPCIFDSESSPTENARTRKPRAILPRNHDGPSRMRLASPDNSRLHILANTTELVFREPRSPSSRFLPSHRDSSSPHISVTATTKRPLSPEIVSTVESTLFTAQHNQTAENELARYRADWKRWIAPLTHLHSLVRRSTDAEKQSQLEQGGGLLSPAEEVKVKNYFLLKYAPWLPTVAIGVNGTLDNVSPFLSAVICATAARTFGGIAQPTMDRLRSLALHRIGHVLSNPLAYPVVESLYALLILIVWPLDAGADVTLLVHSAKRMASNGKLGGMDSTSNDGQPNPEDKDHKRLWYSICANETVLTMGAGTIATPPDISDFIHIFGTGSQIALRHGNTSDVLLALEIKLHKIIAAALGDRPISPDKDISRLPEVMEIIQDYIPRVSVFRTNLIEWEIEFYTIKEECEPRDTVYYVVLEIEYHFLSLMFVSHATLTIGHACPMFTAPEGLRTTVWSWCTTVNKSALAIIRLFNTYTVTDADSQSYSLPPLAVAPDRIFAMVVIAIMLLLRLQITVGEYLRRRGFEARFAMGFTRQAENSVRKAIRRMREVEHMQGASAHHPTAKYVDILEALMRCWDRKQASNAGSLPLGDGLTMGSQASGSDGGSGDSGAVGVNAEANPSLAYMHQNDAGRLQWDNDLSLLGGDLFSDAAAAFTREGVGAYNYATTGL
ncbi:hypothetical protein BU17DRAFT_85729 [Hysterangium stoloniferum]|nr:hypothetical protein BU17DRAFT_85729 [Hysterangium stoloniferum]